MARTSTPEQNLAALKKTAGKGSETYATIKPQYTGSWHDDIQQLSNMTGITPQKLLEMNPWLNNNNFVANNHGYTVIRLSDKADKDDSGTSSTDVNDVPSGYYATNSWVFPLGVGTWYCSTGYSSAHRALDFTTGVPGRIAGYPIYATKAGTVVQNYTSDSWGNTILIRHDDTTDSSGNCYYSRYAHMISKATQEVGSKVSQGDKLGAVGNTGKSTGYHLHFQLYFTSATRTDYTNFNATAPFSVNPNSISDFPGIPWTEHQYGKVDYVKSPYITDDDMNVIIGAVKGDGSVTQSQFDQTVNSIANKICQGQGVTTGSDLEQIVHDFVKKQLDGLKEQGEEAVYQLINGGNFYYIFDTFCENVVHNAIWYIENKVGETLVTAGTEFVNETKTNLKKWVFEATNLDPTSDTARDLGVYLDSYVDSIVQNGWSAVQTAISTGDVQTACQVFLDNTKRDSIDFMCNVTAHGCATAITSYIPTIIDDTDKAQIVTDLSIGILNTTVQSVGGVLKGDISIAQAAKNILSQAVVSIAATVVNTYIAPYIIDIISNALTQAIIAAITAAGGIVGGPLGTAIAAIVGAAVGTAVRSLINFLLQKLVGFFTQ